MAKTGTASIQNCTWPLQRAGRGLRRGSLAVRIHTAIRNLLTTPVGFYPWAPGYGWRLQELRAQGHTEEELDLINAEVPALISYWIPGAVVERVELEADPDTEDMDIQVLWHLKDAIPIFRTSATEPYKTTVST